MRETLTYNPRIAYITDQKEANIVTVVSTRFTASVLYTYSPEYHEVKFLALIQLPIPSSYVLQFTTLLHPAGGNGPGPGPGGPPGGGGGGGAPVSRSASILN